jgi:hypothetical protein
MMFLVTQIGMLHSAISCAYVNPANHPDKPMGVVDHFMRYNETKNNSLPAHMKNSVRFAPPKGH